MRVLGLLAAVGALPFLLPGTGGAVRAQAVPTSKVDIVVREARGGAAVARFKWMINLDNSHESVSMSRPQSFSPVIATGDETNAAAVVLPETTPPDRGYLVSVYADPEYKLGGKHFSLPADAGDITVELRPNPLPLATLTVRVFHDNGFVNGRWDQPLEDGLRGFRVTISDRRGKVTTDWFGNPICTRYKDLNGNGRFDFPGDVSSDGGPDRIRGTGGVCTTGPDGIATIPNLGPSSYEVEATRPRGSGWILTPTTDGGRTNEARLEEGARGYVRFGFVKACRFGNRTDGCPTNGRKGTGSISGKVHTSALDESESVFALGNPIANPYVALSDIGARDEQVYTGRGNGDGSFTIPDVPAGLYVLTVWDEPIDHRIRLLRVRVEPGETVDIGGIVGGRARAVAAWFGKLRGTVYADQNENGVRDPGEPGLSPFGTVLRFKDGATHQAAGASSEGAFEFPEVSELEHFLVVDVGYGRFEQTGAAAYLTDELGNPRDYPWVDDCTDIDGKPVTPCTAGSTVRECTDADDWHTCERGPINQDVGLQGLRQGVNIPAGKHIYVDFGKKAFGPGKNGGIVGTVFNATTRNQLDARLQENEDYEPGVPGVRVNLFAPALDANGGPVIDSDGSVEKDHLANVYNTDAWYDLLPTGCIGHPSFGRDPTGIEPPELFPNCLELPSLLEQARPGVSDGGYAFEQDCSNPDPDGDDDSDHLANRFDPDSLAVDCAPVPPGLWIVEIAAPTGYRPVMEEDVKVFGSDQFVPAVPPPPCAGPVHTVDVVANRRDADFDPAKPSTTQGVYNPGFLATTSGVAPKGGSPFQGKRRPLCDARLVELGNGSSASSDFFIFTDAVDADPDSPGGQIPTGSGIPPPGRIVGVLFDDLALDVDPLSPSYAGKRAIANAPVGIRDFSGRLITTVFSDEHGRFEVLLPSTGTYNCPPPGGPCPGMYFVVGNDPGDLANPNPGFNPSYQTLSLVFDVWPGLTTYADVAVISSTAFAETGQGRFGARLDTPPACKIQPGTPDPRSVSQPYGTTGTSITIDGTGFGPSGDLMLGGVPVPTTSWTDASITFAVPPAALVAPGAHPLSVKNNAGRFTNPGITFHLLGAGYNPPQRHVGPGQPYTDLQAALDDAVDGDLVLVHPGTYFGHFILHDNVKLQGFGRAATILDGRFTFGATPGQADFDAKVLALKGASFAPSGRTLAAALADASTGDLSPATISGVSGLQNGDVIRIDGEEMLIVEPRDLAAASPPFELLVRRGLNGTTAAAHSAGAPIAVGHGWDGPVGARLQPWGVALEGVPWGQVITVLARDGEFHAGFSPQIDGFFVRFGRAERGDGTSQSQGGGIYLHGFARHVEISNNLVQGNFGSRGGGIILGLPTDYYGDEDNENDDVRIYNNRVLNNGSKARAGSIAIFNGAESYEIDHNIICGNFSAEYGAGISHFGKSPGGRIHDNKILFNAAFVEGGGIRVAGELRGRTAPGQPGTGLSPGSGPVTVERNLIQGNVSNNDGGGIRLSNPVQWKVRIARNIVVNNLAAGHGGGISLDGALDVEIVDNTVAKNLSTSTADLITEPQGAGVTSELHGQALESAIAAGTVNCPAARRPKCQRFSYPVFSNNLVWENEAFQVDGGAGSRFDDGLQSGGFLDFEVIAAGGTENFDATFSDCTAASVHCPDGPRTGNTFSDPAFAEEVALDFEVLAFAADPAFIHVLLRSTPGAAEGSYHLPAGPPS